MSFVVGAAALFSVVGAIAGWLVGTILARVLSPRVRMWVLRLAVTVSLLPLLWNVDYAQSQAVAELGRVPALGTFVTVSWLIILVAMVAGWTIYSFYPPLVAGTPPAALIAYYHLALRSVLWREGFWQDNIPLVWLLVAEAGAAVFLLTAGWLVWRARNTHGLTYPSVRRG